MSNKREFVTIEISDADWVAFHLRRVSYMLNHLNNDPGSIDWSKEIAESNYYLHSLAEKLHPYFVLYDKDNDLCLDLE